MTKGRRSGLLLFAAAMLFVQRASADDGETPEIEISQRATLLAADMSDTPLKWRHVKAARVVGIVLDGLTTGLTGTWLALASPRDRPFVGALFGAGASGMAAGIVSFAVPEDYSFRVLMIGGDVSIGSYNLSLGLIPARTDGGRSDFFPPATAFTLAAGHFGRATLQFADILARRPISYRVLAAHYERLRNPAVRAALTADELADIESDLQREGSWMDPWLLNAPVIVAGVAGTTYSLAGQGLSDQARGWGTALSALTAMGGLAMAAGESMTGWRLYSDQLGDAGLTVSVGPGPGAGASLEGSF
jgi:hypothetical protein